MSSQATSSRLPNSDRHQRRKPTFAEQMPLFLRAPLHKQALWRLIPAVLVMAVAQAFQRIPGLGILMWWVALAAQFVVLWYGLELLARFSAGVFDSDALWPDTNIDQAVLVRALAAWVVLTLVTLLIHHNSRNLGLFVELLFAFVKPAILMLIVLGNPLLEALSPKRWWDVIGTLGSRYFMLFVLLWMLFALRSWALGLEGGYTLMVPLADFVSLYVMLVSCCMMGYCLYEKSEELDLTTAEEWNEQFAHQRAVRPDDKPVDAWMQEGKPEQALAHAYELARMHPHEVDDQLRYYNLLKKLDRKPELIEHQAEKLMLAYAHAGQLKDAADLLKREQSARLNVLHDAPPDLFMLAQALRRTHDPEHIRAALSLVASYVDVSVGEMGLPRFLLLQAKCHHALGEKSEAKELLKRIATRYPPELPEVQEARAALEGKKSGVPTR